MSYSSFKTLTQVQASFHFHLQENQRLFTQTATLQPSEYLQITLHENTPLANAVNTEKARSELIITPILLEVRRYFQGQVSFFSGTEFTVDPAQGLQGYCDYILTASAQMYEIEAPVITIVEAKNENIKGGLAQCVAEMIAAAQFNAASQNTIATILGAVTTGTVWKFLTLQKQTVAIDLEEYYIKEIDKILGILVSVFPRHK